MLVNAESDLLVGAPLTRLEHIATSPARFLALGSNRSALEHEERIPLESPRERSHLRLPVGDHLRSVLLVRGGQFLFTVHDGRICLWDLWTSTGTAAVVASQPVDISDAFVVRCEDHWFGDDGRLYVALAAQGPTPPRGDTTFGVYAINLLGGTSSFEKINELRLLDGHMWYHTRWGPCIAFSQTHRPLAGVWNYRTGESALWRPELIIQGMMLKDDILTCVHSNALTVYKVPALESPITVRDIAPCEARVIRGPSSSSISYHIPHYIAENAHHSVYLGELELMTTFMSSDPPDQSYAASLPLPNEYNAYAEGTRLGNSLVTLFHTPSRNNARCVVAAVVPPPKTDGSVESTEGRVCRTLSLLREVSVDMGVQMHLDPTSGTFVYSTYQEPNVVHIVRYLKAPDGVVH